MKKIIFVFLITSLVVILGCTQAETSNSMQTYGGEAGSTVNIEIKGFAYNPSTVTIKKGTTVTWTNQDSAPHTVTSVSGSELSSDTLSQGNIYSHTFNAAGAFDYYCTIHPNMKATVVVD